MKKLIILSILFFMAKSAICQDTLNIKSIKVKYNKYERGFHNLKIDYVLRRDNEFIPVKNGRELTHLHSLPEENNTDSVQVEMAKK